MGNLGGDIHVVQPMWCNPCGATYAVQCKAKQCNESMQSNATQRKSLQHNATLCNALQRTANHCNEKQCKAMQSSA
eukprot:914433-Pyramimonas_sp.AAC.1